jgi:hypothetical protein
MDPRGGPGDWGIHYVWAVTSGPAHMLPFDISDCESEIARHPLPELGIAAPGDGTESRWVAEDRCARMPAG